MTIICALHQPGVGTWIGSDTLVADRGFGVVGFKPKWSVGDGVAIGVCGSNAAGDCLGEAIGEVRPDWSGPSCRKWMHRHLIEMGMKSKGEAGEDVWFDCSLLLATPTRVLSVCPAGGGVEQAPGGFFCRGSGGDHADGAAHVLLRRNVEPRKVVEAAIGAAIAFGNGCGGEIWVDLLRESAGA